MHNIKILIAEELENSQLKISEHLKKEGDFNVLGSYEEEAKLLNTLKIVQVDVLIVTLFKSKFDGVKIIEELKNNTNEYLKPKHIVAVTHFISNYVNSKLIKDKMNYKEK